MSKTPRQILSTRLTAAQAGRILLLSVLLLGLFALAHFPLFWLQFSNCRVIPGLLSEQLEPWGAFASLLVYAVLCAWIVGAGKTLESILPDAAIRNIGKRFSRRGLLVMAIVGSLLAAWWYTDVPRAAHHAHFLNFTDVGIYSEVIKNTAQGRILASDGRCDGGCYLQDHFCPILVSLAPFWRLFEGPGLMIWAHSLAMAAGAVPLLFLALHFGAPAIGCIALLLAYWLHPAMTQLAFCDGRGPHAEGLAVAFTLAAFLFALKRKYVAFGVFALIAATAKEDVPLIFMFFGAYVFLFGKRRRLGAAIAAASALVFIIVTCWVMPACSGDVGYRYASRYAGLGGSLTQIVLSPLLKPGVFFSRLLGAHSWMCLLWLTAPLLFLPWRAAPVMLTGLGIFMMTVLQDDPNLTAPGFHYHTHMIPVIFLAACSTLGRRTQAAEETSETEGGDRSELVSPSKAAALIAVALLGQCVFGASRFSMYLDKGYVGRAPLRRGIDREVRQLVPASATVVSTDLYLNHLLHCRRTFRYVSAGRIRDADFVVIDLAETGNRRELIDYYLELMRSGALSDFRLAYARLGVLAFARGKEDGAVRGQLLPKPPVKLDTALRLRLGDDSLMLGGYDIVDMPVSPSGKGVKLFWQVRSAKASRHAMFAAEVLEVSASGPRTLARGRYLFGEGYALPELCEPGCILTNTIPLDHAPASTRALTVKVCPTELFEGPIVR